MTNVAATTILGLVHRKYQTLYDFMTSSKQVWEDVITSLGIHDPVFQTITSIIAPIIVIIVKTRI